MYRRKHEILDLEIHFWPSISNGRYKYPYCFDFFPYAACKFLLSLLAPWHFLLVHSFILLAQAITLSTCIVAHNNALLALLVSNNFAEIKSNVFKRFSKDNIHSLVYAGKFTSLHLFLDLSTSLMILLCVLLCIYCVWYCPMDFGGLHGFLWSFVVHCLWTDSIERFHISAFLLFVLAQNILEAEGPWFESFLFVSSPENI